MGHKFIVSLLLRSLFWEVCITFKTKVTKMDEKTTNKLFEWGEHLIGKKKSPRLVKMGVKTFSERNIIYKKIVEDRKKCGSFARIDNQHTRAFNGFISGGVAVLAIMMFNEEMYLTALATVGVSLLFLYKAGAR